MSGLPTILVTGSSGFAGLAVCEALAKNGHAVFGTVRPESMSSPRTALLKDLGVDARPLDVCDRDAVHKLMSDTKPDVVVHLAAQASPQGGDLSGYVRNNIGAFANLVEAATRVGTGHVVYTSTYGVYGDANAAPQREDMVILPPANLYAATKYANELLAHAMPPGGPALTGLRLFNLYGPWQRADTMPAFFAKKLLVGEAVPLFAEGTLVRDYIDVADAAEAVRLLVNAPAQGHRLFNVGSGEGTTVKDFTTKLAHALGVDATIDPKPARAIDIPASYADISALTTATGWMPKTRLEDGLQRFAAWYTSASLQEGSS